MKEIPRYIKESVHLRFENYSFALTIHYPIRNTTYL